MRKASFPPVVAPDTRVLVLGSLPGERSLAERRYYAHPQNRFWPLLGPVIGVDLVSLPYEERLAALLQARIGLWDTVASAERQGSLDGRSAKRGTMSWPPSPLRCQPCARWRSTARSPPRSARGCSPTAG